MQGCVSVVHVVVTLDDDGRVQIGGAADSRIARGVLALVAEGMSGMHSEKFLQVSASEVASAAGLPANAGGASRAAALGRILSHAQTGVRLLLSPASPSAERASTPRYTDTQPLETAVLLSGGVDSSVALRLAMQSGRRVRPFYLRVWLAEDEAHLGGECPWAADVAAAEAVCEQAGVELEQVPLQDAYANGVVKYVVAEAKAGRTPNPDVMCNARVKFGAFLDFAGERFPRVVSGHYARVRRDESGRASLHTAPDAVKDQTYFLAGLSQAQVARAEFPLGRMQKPDVRRLARELDLPNRDRPDSQGVCFLGKLRWEDFLSLHIGVQPGDLVEFETGKVLGEHNGFWLFTLGQRKGIGLGNGPWYVVSKDVERNVVFVSRRYWGDGVGLERDAFEVEDSNWISGDWPVGVGEEMGVKVKVRHGPRFGEAVLRRTGKDRGGVRLVGREKSLAPGQFAVFYDGDLCLGSAVICSEFAVPPYKVGKELETVASGTVPCLG